VREKQKHYLYRHTIGLLPRSRFLYKVCHIYMRHYFGFNYGLDSDDGELWLAAQVLKNKLDPIAFDVGANVGDWTLAILALNPKTHIHAFEPAITAFEKMVSRVTAPNVRLNRLGVGVKRETLTFYEYGVSAVSTFHANEGRLPVNSYPVDIVSVSEYCQENNINRIDFLKIDTEGHDFWVLQGAEPLLKEQRIEVVQFEYGPGNIDSHVLLKNVFDFLSRLPYNVFRLYPRYLLPVPTYGTELENFISVNYILVANSHMEQYANIKRIKTSEASLQ